MAKKIITINFFADIGSDALSYDRILSTKVALFRFQTPSSGTCDGMRDRSQNKWAAAGNGNADPEGWLSPL